MSRTPLARCITLALVSAFILTVALCLRPHTVWAQPEHEPHIILLDSYPPFYNWENNRPVGPLVDIISKAFRRMGLNVEFRKSTWKRSLFEVKNGDADGLCAGAVTPERQEYAVYPEEPLDLEENWVVTRADSLPGMTCMADLKGKTVGMVAGYTYGEEFDNTTTLTKKEYLTEMQLMKMLLAGRVDIVVGNRQVLEHTVAQADSKARLEYHFKISEYGLYLMLSKAKDDSEELAQHFARTLRSMRSEGSVRSPSIP